MLTQKSRDLERIMLKHEEMVRQRKDWEWQAVQMHSGTPRLLEECSYLYMVVQWREALMS